MAASCPKLSPKDRCDETEVVELTKECYYVDSVDRQLKGSDCTMLGTASY
jgi:hypothetical protein